MTSTAMATNEKLTVSPGAVEQFLYEEARLLDRWMLEEWGALFEPDGRYQIAPAGVEDEVDPNETLFYVDDDRLLIRERAVRLSKRTAHAEFPHSKCRHMVTNVQILGGGDSDFEVAANFIVFRTKFGKTDVYPGHYLYRLCAKAGRISIRRKRAYLDIANLYEQAKVSIIL
ncbi:MAG: aromatic-ring-hydroxylating dioxygenase subunit beta [Hyphomonadaceae bacterium]